jgi:hypothetical protein
MAAPWYKEGRTTVRAPEEQWDQFAEQVHGMYPQMARLTIVPTWAKVFDFSTGRVPAFLQRLAAERARREAAIG